MLSDTIKKLKESKEKKEDPNAYLANVITDVMDPNERKREEKLIEQAEDEARELMMRQKFNSMT